MNLLISLVVFLIVIGIIFWATRAISSAFKIPAPIEVTVQVILVIIALIWLLQFFGRAGAFPKLQF